MKKLKIIVLLNLVMILPNPNFGDGHLCVFAMIKQAN